MDQEKSSERLCERDKLRRWRLTREKDGGYEGLWDGSGGGGCRA